MLVSALLKSSDTVRASCSAQSSFCLRIKSPGSAAFGTARVGLSVKAGSIGFRGAGTGGVSTFIQIANGSL